jgi:hypothetical protein
VGLTARHAIVSDTPSPMIEFFEVSKRGIKAPAKPLA